MSDKNNMQEDDFYEMGKSKHSIEEKIEAVYLIFDGSDEEVRCDVLGIFQVEDDEYIALLPEGEDNIILYEYEESGGDINLMPIEDEEELDLVYEAYQALFDEDYEENAEEMEDERDDELDS